MRAAAHLVRAIYACWLQRVLAPAGPRTATRELGAGSAPISRVRLLVRHSRTTGRASLIQWKRGRMQGPSLDYRQDEEAQGQCAADSPASAHATGQVTTLRSVLQRSSCLTGVL